MDRIFYLMGKSASGKDTIYRRLLADSELGLRECLIYTTRPIRSGEAEGREYHFVTDEELRKLEKAGKVIEVRDYHTVHGIWRYATVDDGGFAEGRGDMLMIGTLESFTAASAYFGADKVIPLYIAVDDGTRLERAIEREKTQKDPCYTEICRRFLADEGDFSRERLTEAGITREYRNIDLESCLAELKESIKSRRG